MIGNRLLRQAKSLHRRRLIREKFRDTHLTCDYAGVRSGPGSVYDVGASFKKGFQYWTKLLLASSTSRKLVCIIIEPLLQTCRAAYRLRLATKDYLQLTCARGNIERLNKFAAKIQPRYGVVSDRYEQKPLPSAFCGS